MLMFFFLGLFMRTISAFLFYILNIEQAKQHNNYTLQYIQYSRSSLNYFMGTNLGHEHPYRRGLLHCLQ